MIRPMKLSFIIPIYNVEHYLQKCVDSLLAQSYHDYEIILVDDGSTDGSGALADEIKRNHADSQDTCAFKVIHQPNAGLSAARNAGLAVAEGDYVCFVDSDDYWLPDSLPALMEQVERDQLDVLRFRYQNVRENGEVFVPNKAEDTFSNYSAEPADGATFLNNRMWVQCYAVMFVIRRELLSDCLFTPGIFFEDMDWMPRMLLRAKRVASADRVVYCYLWRTGSITLTPAPEKLRKRIDDKLGILARYQEYGRQMPWIQSMTSNTVMSIIGALAGPLYAERTHYLQQLEALRVFPLSQHMVASRALRKLRLINLSPRLAVWILHLIRLSSKTV